MDFFSPVYSALLLHTLHTPHSMHLLAVKRMTKEVWLRVIFYLVYSVDSIIMLLECRKSQTILRGSQPVLVAPYVKVPLTTPHTSNAKDVALWTVVQISDLVLNCILIMATILCVLRVLFMTRKHYIYAFRSY